METLAVGATFIDGGFANRVIAAVSSHNATAERQFRYPTEYGGQRPGTATSTVTGAGTALISKEQSSIKITAATIGKVQDLGITDPFDMGSAMAPAAAHTIQQHFEDLQRSAADYDLIVTGDLSGVGAPITRQLLLEEGYDLGNVYNDCGLMIYSEQQQVFAGKWMRLFGSCYIWSFITRDEKRKFAAHFCSGNRSLIKSNYDTAKETIPTIAHGVVFERVKGV